MENQKLIFSKTRSTSILLSNSLNNIEYYEEKRIDFERAIPVRATDTGIAGTAIVGKECGVYVHSDSTLITRYIKDKANIDLKSNRHTRYAQWFVNRLGGLKKIRSLVLKGGLEILVALCSNDAEQSGMEFSSIVNFLRDKIGMSHQEAENKVKPQLPYLLSVGLVRRGYSLKCPICDLEEWYSVDQLNEFIVCKGCIEKFQLPGLDKYKFSYKPDELSVRIVQTGGVAVLMSVHPLIGASPQPFIQFGGDLFEPSARKNFADIDLIVLVGNTFIIVERKYYPIIYESKQIKDIVDSLEKNVEIAEKIRSQIIILGIVNNIQKSDENLIQELHNAIDSITRKASEKGIKVYFMEE